MKSEPSLCQALYLFNAFNGCHVLPSLDILLIHVSPLVYRDIESQITPILDEIRNFIIAGNLILLCLKLCYYLDLGSNLCIHLLFIIVLHIDVEMISLMNI